ncbi:MAG: type II CAAX endopeptidase family protein [Sphaerochaetaceae bacterium]|nr:type II CAAX endopeptidase family protein [Sphaerochaetaceae bacterium]
MEKPRRNLMQKDTKIESSPFSLALAMVLSLLFWLILGPYFVTMLGHFNIPYLRANAPFLAMALGIVVSWKLLLTTSPRSLITDHSTFRLILFFKSMGAYLLVAMLFLLLGLMVEPEAYSTSDASILEHLMLLPLVLVLTPIQTSSEEVVFRVFPIRVVQGEKLRRGAMRNVLACVLSAILFTAPHLSNRELGSAENPTLVLVFYALFGGLVTALSIATGGFEPALAIHAANNLFVALICNYKGSSLPSLPLLTTTKAIGTPLDLLQLIIGLLMVFLMVRKDIMAQLHMQK